MAAMPVIVMLDSMNSTSNQSKLITPAFG